MHTKKIIAALGLLAVIIIAITWGRSQYRESHALYSRAWIEYAMEVVRETKPTPPASARLYAYVSTVYYEVLMRTNDQHQASLATASLFDFLYPNYKTHTDEKIESLNIRGDLTPESKEILDTYIRRYQSDPSSKEAIDRPVGDEYWVGENPLEPRAGTWRRWIIDGEVFEVAPPPTYGSNEYREALEHVKASMTLTNEQAAAINFWGGGPGSEAPAGIWQNRLHTETRNLNLTDKDYAYKQMILAQSLADAFIECWKVKYEYWTKRPSMADPSIDLIWMANPNFPSYVSGHSVISFTAANVLSALLPQHRELWFANAEEAKNSRLWAGIHFKHDIEEGKNLGNKIGEAIVSKLGLKTS